MPKSRRNRVVHLTQVAKKTRADKEQLFSKIRDSVPEYQHCFLFSVDNMRNNNLKTMRQELASDSRLFFGKTKLMARALGLSPEDAQADGLDKLSRSMTGSVGLIFTNRTPEAMLSYLSSISEVDFARAGSVASRDFKIPSGVVYSTAGEVPAADDVPVAHSREAELRSLGVPTRLVRGKVVLGDEDGGSSEGYVVCKEGDVLDSRQTRLLKFFDVCMSEFRVKVVSYWSAATGEVTEVDPDAMDGVEAEESD